MPRHASPVARASPSRLTPTENQPRWGCLQDRAFGLAPGPWAPTYDFSSCFFPKFKFMHLQNRNIKLYTVVLLFLCFPKFLLKLCCL